MVVDQIRNCRRVAEVATSVELPEATVFEWVRQDKIDRVGSTGTSTNESSKLRAAKRRIAKLEVELATVKRASELFTAGRSDGQMMRPKDCGPIVERLAEESECIKRVCRILGLPSSTFLCWRRRPTSARSVRRAWLTDVICQIHAESWETYGARRIKAELADIYGQVVIKKLIRSVMAEQGICGLPSRRRRRTNQVHLPSFDDLVNRDFERDGPNHLWMTDITQHPTRGRKVHCCCVLDAWSRRVVG
jgi:transposase-like protein